MVMLCGWEGNRNSGVALSMRHRLSSLSTYGLDAYAPHGMLYLFVLLQLTLKHVPIEQK